MVKIQIEYLGELRCRAVHAPSGKTLETDAPVDNQGRGESFSPTDLAATALGTCMATILGILARRQGWNLSGMRVEVRKEMTATPPRRIRRLETEIWLPLPASADPDGLVEKAALACPVQQSLHPDVEKVLTLHWASP